MTAARTAGAVEISSSGEGGEGDYARAEAADELAKSVASEHLNASNTSSSSISICKEHVMAKRRESSTYDAIVFKSYSLS